VRKWRPALMACLLAGMVAWTGLAQSPAPPPPKEGEKTPSAPISDIELVERLNAARKEYQSSLEKLRQYYIRANDIERAKWAEEELLGYHRLVKYAYRLDLDVPVPTLQPKRNIPEANELYRRAMTYKDRGFGADYVDNQRRTEILLQQLLDRYPESDKIADTAYQLGDLYEKYRPAPQPRRAAAYYERSFQWNKAGQSDARLRAARLYDRQLSERSKAIEMYRSVLDHDTDNDRIREAERRIAELTGKR
jgi:hypothetical protein